MNTINATALRLATALHLCEILPKEESEQSIQKRIDAVGIDKTVQYLNKTWSANLSVGPYVLYSPARDRFWSEDLGWLVTEYAANGYSEREMRLLKAHKVCGAPDAEFRKYGHCELLAA